ncbi:hypothetical protein A3743_11830 [Oleiphilus sp. HI0072]|nr:hypothetical protein A3743_11830 [Oleiphilus sp. HI0072]
MKYFSFLLALMSCLLSPVSANAEWIQVTGQADFDGQRYDLARDRARQDALKQALLQAGARVKSDQRVSNGKISKDYFSVSGEARIRKSVLQDEFVKKGILNLVMNFDVEEVASCPDSQAKKYRKKIAVLGFSVQSPAQLRLGGVHNIERGLASALNQSLQLQDKLVVFEQSEFSLHQDVINAPSHFTSQSTLTKAADYAKQVGAQFVISGVVRDLSLEDPEAFSTSYWAKLKRMSNNANIKRRFAMELFVHDGYSGAIIWQRSFAVSAPWEDDIDDLSGFGTAEFWSDEYGLAVAQLVDGVATLVGEQLECQPFIARISRVDGKTLHFNSGASSGVRPGDKFSLYRTYNYYDADMLAGTELTNVKTSLTVSQVHPGFASGSVSIDPGRINIQEDDLLIAW